MTMVQQQPPKKIEGPRIGRKQPQIIYQEKLKQNEDNLRNPQIIQQQRPVAFPGSQQSGDPIFNKTDNDSSSVNNSQFLQITENSPHQDDQVVIDQV